MSDAIKLLKAQLEAEAAAADSALQKAEGEGAKGEGKEDDDDDEAAFMRYMKKNSDKAMSYMKKNHGEAMKKMMGMNKAITDAADFLEGNAGAEGGYMEMADVTDLIKALKDFAENAIPAMEGLYKAQVDSQSEQTKMATLLKAASAVIVEQNEMLTAFGAQPQGVKGALTKADVGGDLGQADNGDTNILAKAQKQINQIGDKMFKAIEADPSDRDLQLAYSMLDSAKVKGLNAITDRNILRKIVSFADKESA